MSQPEQKTKVPPSGESCSWVVAFQNGFDYLFNRKLSYTGRHMEGSYAFSLLPAGTQQMECGNIFIKGSPGCGKTKLAVQMLSSVRKMELSSPPVPQGHVGYSIYISMEEDCATIQDYFVQQGGALPIPVAHACPTDSMVAVTTVNRPGPPVHADRHYIRIVSCASVFRRDLSNRQAALELIESMAGLVLDLVRNDATTIANLGKETARPFFVVVDNLYALKPSTERDRSLIAELTRKLRNSVLRGLGGTQVVSGPPFLVYVSGASDESWFESGFCDVVVRFGEVKPEDYSQRVVAIEKFRHQDHVRGQHPYKITARGLRAFPSIYSIHPKPPDGGDSAAGAPADAGATGAPPLYAEELNALLPNRIRASGRFGRVIFFVGPKYCYKSKVVSIIELAHLNAVKAGESRNHVLSIRFQEKTRDATTLKNGIAGLQGVQDHAHVMGLRRWYTSVRHEFEPFHLTLHGIDPGPAGENVPFPLYIDLLVKQGTVYREEMLDYIASLLYAYRLSFPNNSLLVTIDDLETTAAFFSFIQSRSYQDEFFVGKLGQIVVEKSPMAVVFSCTVPDKGTSPFDIERAQIIADAVLTFEQFCIFGAKNIVTISGQRATGTSGESRGDGRDVVPLALFEDMRTGDVTFDPSYLSGFIGFHDKVLHRPGIELFLQMEHIQSQRRYVNRLRTMFEGFLYDQVFVEWHEEMDASRRFDPSEAAAVHSPKIPSAFEKSVHPTHDFVKLRSISSSESDSFEDAVCALGGRPLSTSVVVQVDEFMLARINTQASQGCRNSSLMSLHQMDVKVSANLMESSLLHKRHASAKAAGKVLETLNRVRSFVVPYYSNVLVLATNCEVDCLDTQGGRDSGSRVSYDKLLAMCEGDDDFYFDFNGRSRETMACLLLDYYHTTMENELPLNAAPDDFHKLKLDAGSSFVRLLLSSSHARQKAEASVKCGTAGGQRGDDENFETRFRNWHLRRSTRGKFAVVLWYSELRILEEIAGVHFDNLTVHSLPGGGFTGDWFLGILQSSVSVTLAEQVIGIMTKQEHEFFRLHDGVGLPFRDEFYGSGTGKVDRSVFPGLHYTNKLTLKTFADIHRQARSRLDYPRYQDIRIPLWRYVSRICRWMEIQAHAAAKAARSSGAAGVAKAARGAGTAAAAKAAKGAGPVSAAAGAIDAKKLQAYLELEWNRFKAAMKFWRSDPAAGTSGSPAN